MPGLHLCSYGECLCKDVRWNVPDEGVLVVHSEHVRLLAGTTNDGPVETGSERKYYVISLSAYGKTARGASSPATDKPASDIYISSRVGNLQPALHMPEPLSRTTEAISSMVVKLVGYNANGRVARLARTVGECL